MKTINEEFLNEVSQQAKESPRLRMNYNFHEDLSDKCQRLLNALEPGTVMPIHRHKHSSETISCLRGRFVIELYDELERICTDRIELTPNGQVLAVNIPLGQWHSLQSLESGTVLLECKDGPWEPLGPEDILQL